MSPWTGSTGVDPTSVLDAASEAQPIAALDNLPADRIRPDEW